MVTKTLVVMGDPQITTTPEHPRGAMLRAYDKATGKQVGAVLDGRAAERIADDLFGRRQTASSSRSAAGNYSGRARRVHAAVAIAEIFRIRLQSSDLN